MISEQIEFTESIESVDWRASAAIVGLMKYLDHFELPYNHEQIFSEEKDKEWDVLRFRKEDITRERYLEFAEWKYSDSFYHITVEKMLSKEEYTKDEISNINKQLVGNTIMKSYFGKIKFDGTNRKEILQILNENRYQIIQESFRNKPLLYKNFCNPFQLFEEKKDVCRINGYCIDIPKKGKSISYRFQQDTYVGEDSKYYDFIVFGFSIGRESFFINDNSSLSALKRTNQSFEQFAFEKENQSNHSVDYRKILFEAIISSTDFIDFDAEVIIKHQDKDFFETLFLRKESIDILKAIKNYKAFCYRHKVTEKYSIDVQERVIDSIINLICLDNIIDFFLKESVKIKESNKFSYLIKQLIDVNVKIKIMIRNGSRNKECNEGRNDEMRQSMKSAYGSAKQVVDILCKRKQVNKIASYRTKLISALVLKDNERFCDILIQLAQYTDVQFNFAFELFENFDDNKDLAYAFVNALSEYEIGKNEKGDN